MLEPTGALTHAAPSNEMAGTDVVVTGVGAGGILRTLDNVGGKGSGNCVTCGVFRHGFRRTSTAQRPGSAD
jgi:hypothetical protein